MPILPERWNITPPIEVAGEVEAPIAVPMAAAITSINGF
jgi:hypothetical protein